MKSAHFTIFSLTLCLLLLMIQPSIAVRNDPQHKQDNIQSINTAGKSPKQLSKQILDHIQKLENKTPNKTCPEKDTMIKQLKKDLQNQRDKNNILEASLKQAQSNLFNLQKELAKTQFQLQECNIKKDCIECPTIKCPTITCPECQHCEICKPCPQCKEIICPSIECPPKIICPTEKPCNCQVCKQPTHCQVCKQPTPCQVCKQPTHCQVCKQPTHCQVCKQPIPCPLPKPCPKTQPCPLPTSCDEYILKITALTQTNKALQSNYNSVLQQRDDCLRDDSATKCQQQLTNINDHLSNQLPKFIQTIYDTLFRSGQRLNFDDTKTVVNKIEREIQNGKQTWPDSLAAFHKISLKLLTQLDSISSLTSDAMELNKKYSSGMKSLRDKLTHCESLLG